MRACIYGVIDPHLALLSRIRAPTFRSRSTRSTRMPLARPATTPNCTFDPARWTHPGSALACPLNPSRARTTRAGMRLRVLLIWRGPVSNLSSVFYPAPKPTPCGRHGISTSEPRPLHGPAVLVLSGTSWAHRGFAHSAQGPGAASFSPYCMHISLSIALAFPPSTFIPRQSSKCPFDDVVCGAGKGACYIYSHLHHSPALGPGPSICPRRSLSSIPITPM
ncbi:hypothetical protein B0H10DRAFT_2106447 [Mycena sp. CBHHK59/15]|nr:hypothetical protein B0H10DRAFT_2106447 [Mycena sp. CBHHK59/15]